MENLPFAFGAAVEIERVGADPVFDLIGFGERRSPLNARGIDLFVGLEIDDDPLWMERIRFAGEFASEVGIAFPIEKVGALDGTVAAGGEAPVWEGVGKNVADWSFEFGAAGEVSALMRGVTPRAVRVPVPGGHAEFTVVAVGDGAPARGDGLLNDVWRVDAVDVAAGENVEGAAKGVVGIEGIYLVGGSGVDVDGGIGSGLREESAEVQT